MNKQLRPFILILFCLGAFLPSGTAHADIGPKPTMEFQFPQDPNGPIVTIISGILYECDQSDCSDATPLEEVGPQGFGCDQNSCSALAYGFSDYHKLEITFSDGITRSSNIFKTAGFDSSYTVSIQQAGLAVKSNSIPLPELSADPLLNLGIYGIITLGFICGACLMGIILIVMVIVLLVRRNKKVQ